MTTPRLESLSKKVERHAELAEEIAEALDELQRLSAAIEKELKSLDADYEDILLTMSRRKKVKKAKAKK